MKKIITSVLLLLSFVCCFATNWLVGPTRTYIKPSQVSTLVQAGDTVSIDPGTYTADVAHWTANNLLLRGTGNGSVHLNANNISYGQKGIWVIGGNNTKVLNIEFSHCHDAAGVDMNWAGIRQEGLNLTVSHCYFHDNDNGILAGTLNPSKIIIEFTEFNHNGYGDGYSHNLYINHVDTLIFRYNYSHHATIGHELKSRANVNYILYNRFSNESTGDASREIDLPNGGPAILIGNIIEQGPNSQNSGIIGYGLEGLSNPAPHEFYLVSNTIVNDKSSGTFVSLSTSTGFYKAYNNIFAGSGTLLNGSAVLTDTAFNWRVTAISSAGFINAAGYDYHLSGNSQAINKGGNAGAANNGFALTPVLEYSHPAANSPKFMQGVLDIGAFENAATGINENSGLKNEFQYWVTENDLVIVTPVSDFRIIIYDVSGKKIFAKDLQAGMSTINIGILPKGFYVLEIRTEKGSVSGKFIR